MILDCILFLRFIKISPCIYMDDQYLLLDCFECETLSWNTFNYGWSRVKIGLCFTYFVFAEVLHEKNSFE